MKQSKIKEIVIPALSLFINCIVVTALLGLTKAVTAPKIEELAVETQEAAKKEVLADAASFGDAEQTQLSGTTYTYYKGLAADGSVMGYVVETGSKGYGGDISLMVGVGVDGTVQGVSILSINETAGLGMNAENPEFLEQFLGKSGTIGVQKNGSSDTEIQALTGATLPSEARADGGKQALFVCEQLGGGGNG